MTDPHIVSSYVVYDSFLVTKGLKFPETVYQNHCCKPLFSHTELGFVFEDVSLFAATGSMGEPWGNRGVTMEPVRAVL